MFSRWINARIHAAGNALNEGRLDEAFERLRATELGRNERADKLCRELAAMLLARARVQLQDGRYTDALADLERIEHLKQTSSEAQELARRAREELAHRADRQRQRGDTFDHAATCIRAGRLDSGRAAVERIEDAAQRERLREKLDVRVQRNEEMLEAVRDLIERGDLPGACAAWLETARKHGRNRATDELGRQLAIECGRFAATCLREGRLDRARFALDAGTGLGNLAPELDEWQHTARLAQDAAATFANWDAGALRHALMRLKGRLGSVEWLERALSAAEQLSLAQEELLASPLGTMAPAVENRDEFRTAAPAHSGDNAYGADVGRGVLLSERPLLLLVDGTGSELIVPRDRVRIGRAGGTDAIDVPLPADIQSHHADIVRRGSDYFLVPRGSAQVNGRRVGRTLLRSGDRIELARGVRMTFRRPSAKSETAVLKLSSRCRAPHDVGQVVLFHGTCLVGPQATCHVQTREGDATLLLFERGGRLLVRRAGRDGRPAGPPEPLEAERTMEFGDLRLTVKEYELDGGAGLG